ncbi:MAG: HNH endonuclease [Kiritimatiellae bacterium]|nr:HNH endonuclease [Kiritimatiellia bacterium]
MKIKCKIERLRANVDEIAQQYFKKEERNVEIWSFLDNEATKKKARAEFKANSIKAIKMISDANSVPVAINKETHLFKLLNPIFYADEYKYRNSIFFLFRGSIYAATGPYTQAECALLVAEMADKERKVFESLARRQDGPELREAIAERSRIPEKTRIAVWRRDQGKCAHCGSRRHLEYDHIIPVAEGGGNTVRNIELLCQECNRSKGKRIG